MKKDKRPINDKGQRHGYWEYYYDNGQLIYKGYYDNGMEVDYIVNNSSKDLFPIY